MDTTSANIRWKYINDSMALIIICFAIITYSFLRVSLPNWYKFIVIMSAFWLFFPDIYKEYLNAKRE